MKSTQEMIQELVKVVNDLGLYGITPVTLSDAGNLTVHLKPHPIVARIAKLLPGDDADEWRGIWQNELMVVDHLLQHNIPVVPYSAKIPPGPYKVDQTWMTLWEFALPVELPPLQSPQAIQMVNDLSEAMAAFQEPLPQLGAWRNAVQATGYLREQHNTDERICLLLDNFDQVNETIQNMELYPAHGDAHPKNLLPSLIGWRWIDFEDVSVMPKFWDLASFIGNTALFNGLTHPMVDAVFNLNKVKKDKAAFKFVLKARTVMSTTTNLALALQGHGDLNFAKGQIEQIKSFLDLLK